MGCRGVYFALNEEDERKLSESTSDEEVLNTIQEEIEERWDQEWLQETDKAWDAMHRCLTDGTLVCKGKTVLEKCVLGGKQLYNGRDYIVSFLKPKEVCEVAESIGTIQKDTFQKKYFGLKKKFLFIDRTEYEGLIGEEDFEYTWFYFEKTREFFFKVAKAKKAVIFTVEQ